MGTKMMFPLRKLPIKRMITLIILSTCTAVLVAACLILAIYEFLDYRRVIVNDMNALADILGRNTRAALAFADETAAQEILLALESKPRVMAACVYASDGSRFAHYARDASFADFPAQAAANEEHLFTKGYLAVFRPIILNDKRIGSIYLRVSLQGLYDRLRLFGGVAGLVLLGSFGMILVLTPWLQRPITQPILDLAKTTQSITDCKDYSLRAQKSSDDEIGHLADSFNEMLGQIQQRDSSLRTEVDERRAAEQSLRASKAQIQTTVDNLAEGVAVSDLTGQLLYFNPAALEMHGFASMEECLRRLPEFVDTFELASLDGTVWPVERWPLARVLSGEKLRDLEVRIRRPKANWQRIFSYSGDVARGVDGQPLMAIITIRDVTERKQAEAKLQAQLARLDLLNRITHAIGERQDLKSIFQIVIRSLEDRLQLDFGCICQYDPAHNVLAVFNVSVRDETLLTELALTDQSQIPIDENGLSRCVRGQLVYEPDIHQVNHPFPQRLARIGLRSLVIAPLLVESKVFGVLAVARKEANSFSSGECEFLGQLCKHVALAAHQIQLYNALQQAYDDLRETQQAIMQQERLRALGQMASGIAHDINNALSPVALYTESLLETEPNLSDRARQYLQTTQSALDDVTETIARMREFYRQRDHQLEQRFVSLNELIEQVADLTRARWNDMPQQQGYVITLTMNLTPDLPAILGVESELREALTNLVLNSADAMPEGGTLTLRTRLATSNSLSDTGVLSRRGRLQESQDAVATRQVYLEVMDSGVGMNDEVRRRCMEPFYTTKGDRGTGLGLAMVYGIAQRHNAEMEIDSQPGKGTTIRLTFPVPEMVAARQPKPDVVYHPVSRLRILVVDDDPLLIKSLRDTLETDGHQIVTANSGQGGIDTFRVAHERGESFAVVITDLGMPYVDGRKVAISIKTASPSTPVILLTGWGQRLVAEDDIPPHVDCVLNKPPKLRELRQALVRYCQTANA